MDEVLEIDRLTPLPDSIIHLIFSSLRSAKDVTRTTVLSKSWKRVFNSYQSFDFDEKWFRIDDDLETERRNFKEYVDRSVATRLKGVSKVDKFRLFVDNADVSLMLSIHRWIRAAMAKNVRELDVQVYAKMAIAIPLHDLTQSDSVTFFKLGGTSLAGLSASKMRNLRGVSIKECEFVNEDAIKKIEENCPVLEDLRLFYCQFLLHLQISSLVKLRRVEVQDCKCVERIEIASSNLETFCYHGYKNQICEINLKGSENLKNLTLRDRMMSDSAFEQFILKFPMLEKLALHQCIGVKKLMICKLAALKSLSLIQCVRLEEVDIDAPNLYSFLYEGRMHYWPFMIHVPRLSELKLSFEKTASRDNKPPRLNFSGNFDGSKGVLMVYTKQNMKIFQGPTKWDLFRTDSCKIELTASLSKVAKAVDNWLRECHGKSLEVKPSKGELLELVKKLVIEREDDLSCCAFSSNKCWRHYIEDVEVSSFKIAAKTLFEFTWRSRRMEEL